MRKTLLFLSFILCQLLAFAQAPQGLNYQAIYRDDKGVAVANQTIAVEFSILENSIVGTSVYTEKHTAQTNAFGLFNLVIGKGAPQTGIFANIDWSNGSKFLKVEVNNTLIGTTQLLSAPYALYAENGSQKLSIKDKTITLSKNGGSINIPKDSTTVRVSKRSDSLWINNTYVIIKGISATYNGGQEADAGQDIFNCQGGAQLDANTPLENATGIWTIISGVGGVLSNPYASKPYFQGKFDENYILKWTITKNGIVNEDLVNIRFEKYKDIQAFAGFDTIVINSNKTTLRANFYNPTEEKGKWSVESGKSGILSDITNPNSTFEGIMGETYLLKWTVYNPSSACQYERFDFIKIVFSNNKVSNKGNYYIPDLRFRRILQVLYPTVMAGDSLKINEVSKITRLDLSNYGITNFDGLQYLTALKYLNCSGNYQSYNGQNKINLPDSLPSNLDTLICQRLGLKKFPKLPNNLKYLDCIDNDFYIINNLSNSLETLKFGSSFSSSETNLREIIKLPDNLKYLFANGLKKIAKLPVIPKGLIILEIRGSDNYLDTSNLEELPILPNTLTSLNISGHLRIQKLPNIPNALEKINVSKTSLSEISFLPSNLLELDLAITQIKTLPTLPNKLEYLSIYQTKIEKLPILPNSLKDIYFDSYSESKIICRQSAFISPNLQDWVKKQLALYPICP